MKQQHLKNDLKLLPVDPAQLRTTDFNFGVVERSDTVGCAEVRDFITRYEWLGKLPTRPTHRFTARLSVNGALAGVVIGAVPNAFGFLLGREHRDLEKLISRGATISWAPKNMGSWLVSASVRWMAKETEFRVFTAYADPQAGELGTIYQAMNWWYLGTTGRRNRYFDPRRPERGWFSGREFRKRYRWKHYASLIGMTDNEFTDMMGKYSPQWDRVTPEVKTQLKAEESKYRASCRTKKFPAKHRYAYVFGRNKTDTRYWRRQFLHHNKIYGYPRERGK